MYNILKSDPYSPAAIVTGLGRCGTSAMMAMLATGLPVLCDPDQAGNGWESVEALTQPYASWRERAAGCAVKVMAPESYQLPPGLPVIVMTRDPAAQTRSARKRPRPSGKSCGLISRKARPRCASTSRARCSSISRS